MGYGKIFQLAREDDIGVVTFDVAGEAMNTWTQEATDEFEALLGDLESASDLRGAVLISGKTENFHAGANLGMLNQMEHEEETRKVMDRFHDMFNRLEGLGFPTVAAVNGYCLGGGYELALACTARIATDSKRTMIGLPECTLGIFPGGGGTQRLPRLIGPEAMELILKGTVLPASEALKKGMIDRLIPEDSDLRREAVTFLKGINSGDVTLNRKQHDFSQIDAMAQIARQEVVKATRGREIPGLMLAVQSMEEGLKVPLGQGLEIERDKFVEAVLTNEAKGSIHTFFLKTMSDKPRTMMTKDFEPRPLNKIAILGFGTMGRGIVIDILRRTETSVVVKDIPEALSSGKAFVSKILGDMAEKKKLGNASVDQLMARLSTTSDTDEAVSGVDLIVEAVYEDLAVKAAVYEEISREASEDCIVASNTSSIPLNAMAAHISHPERFGGAHFFSPVWRMQLVEVIQGDKTSRETVDNLLNFVAAIRKRPIVCKDHPGFVVNAVLFPYFLRALEFLEHNNPIEKVDDAFLRFGMPVGPIRLVDEVGVDISYHVVAGKGMEQETLKNWVSKGHTGLKKSGKGIFLNDGSVDPEARDLIVPKGEEILSAEEMQQRVLKEMVRVGKDLLDKNIVTDPRMIDIGMIWGTGFPPEKGGPMKWADLIGLSRELFGEPFYG